MRRFTIRAPFITLAAVALVALVLGNTALAQSGKLKVGDPAPPPSEGKWVKGEPVKSFEPGKVYVMEFWATWCGPCVRAIPHVTELQKKYAGQGLVVIGQNVWEDNEAAVEPFVKKMGDKMDYRVVMDAGKGGPNEKQMARTWMAAAGQEGIPCSFIVDKEGKVAWIGHPMQMEAPLKKILSGEGAVAEKGDEAVGGDRQSLMAELQKFEAQLKANDPDAYKTAEKLAVAGKDEPQLLNAVAWTIVDTAGVKNRDLDMALRLAQKAVTDTHEKDAAILDTLARVYFERGDAKKAYEVESKAVAVADPKLKEELQADLARYKAAAEK